MEYNQTDNAILTEEFLRRANQLKEGGYNIVEFENSKGLNIVAKFQYGMFTINMILTFSENKG